DVVVVEHGGEAAQRLFAAAAVQVLARGDLQFAAKNRERLREFGFNHMQTLIYRQADALQQTQQVDQQWQFLRGTATAVARLPLHRPFRSHVAEAEAEEAADQEGRCRAVGDKKPGEGGQQQAEDSTRDEEQRLAAIVVDTALVE